MLKKTFMICGDRLVTFEHLWLPVLLCRRLDLSASSHMHAISAELEIYAVLVTKPFPL